MVFKQLSFVLHLLTPECFMVFPHRKKHFPGIQKPIFFFRAEAVKLLDENYVCDKIVDSIRRNKRFVMLPPHTILFYILKG
jgi:hypothetical protein